MSGSKALSTPTLLIASKYLHKSFRKTKTQYASLVPPFSGRPLPSPFPLLHQLTPQLQLITAPRPINTTQQPKTKLSPHTNPPRPKQKLPHPNPIHLILPRAPLPTHILQQSPHHITRVLPRERRQSRRLKPIDLDFDPPMRKPLGFRERELGDVSSADRVDGVDHQHPEGRWREE